MSLDDDSLDLQVEPPKEEKARIAAHISSWEFQAHCWEPQELKMYFVASDVYITHLIERTEEPRLTDHQKKRLGPECLILQEFSFEWLTENGSKRERDQYRAELVLSFAQFRGLTVLLRLGELQISTDDTIQARFLYYGPGEQTNSKTYNLAAVANEPGAFSCLIDEKLFQTYLKPRLAIEFTIKRDGQRERKFRGIQNEGNTCYMNSTLQILYFLRPLRKTILEFEGKSPLMEAIKQVFAELLDVASDSASFRAVDASELLSAYGRFPDPRKQQDIHEFLLGFLDELEGECPQLKELWLGHGKQILNSRDPQKPYTSTLSQEFNELDLLLQDHKGNTLGSLSYALTKTLDEEHVQDKIETDDYGKVQVTKRRIITELPKVVFFNLKRYHYNKDRNRLVKILADFEYPAIISLGFLQGTPTGQEEDYVLFGVAVHRGQAYNSGHYFSFVNTSQHPDKPHWIKFNDSVVQVSSEETALSFTGGKRKTINWSRDYQRFIQREIPCEETAYLLTYIRRDKFEEYQSLPTPIPRDWALKKRQSQKKTGKTQDVQLLVLADDVGDLFDDHASLPLALDDDEEVHQHLARISHGILGIRPASIWKVIRHRRKVKRLVHYVDLPQTPARIFGYLRGHGTPDYLLVVPDTMPVFRTLPSSDESRRERLGIVCVIQRGGENVERSYRIVEKDSLQDFKAEQEKRLSKLGHFGQDKDRFMYDWSDLCTIIFD